MAEDYMNLLKQSGFAMNRIVAGIIQAGTSPTANATVVTVTFTSTWQGTPKCGLWPANSAAAALNGAGQVFAPIPTTTAFTISSGTSPLAASTTYIWGYRCDQ
jgi:hypothetical protein